MYYMLYIIHYIILSKCRLLHYYERHLVAISVVKWYYTYLCAFLWSEMARTGVPHIATYFMGGSLGPLKSVLALFWPFCANKANMPPFSPL